MAYAFFVLKNIVFQPLYSMNSKFKCMVWRVKVGNRVKFLGVPRIRNIGKLSIGDDTRIISDSRNVVGSGLKTTFQTGISGEIIIGKNCGISNCCLVSQSRIIIGDRVYIGGGVRIYDNDFHSINPDERLNNPEIIPKKEIIIGNQVFIGAHSLILKGVQIGENAVIGAGSVVTRNVGANEIWAGVPAKKINSIT